MFRSSILRLTGAGEIFISMTQICILIISFVTPLFVSRYTITEYQADKAKNMEKILEKKCNHICEELPLASYKSFLARLQIDYFLYTFTNGNNFNNLKNIENFNASHQMMSHPKQVYEGTDFGGRESDNSKMISPRPPVNPPTTVEIDYPSAPILTNSIQEEDFYNLQSANQTEESNHLYEHHKLIGILKELFNYYSLIFNLKEKDPGYESYLRSWIERYTSFLYNNLTKYGINPLDLDLILCVYCVRTKSIWASNLIRWSLDGLNEEDQLIHILKLLKGRDGLVLVI